MKSPRILAALAMAAVLTTGVSAHAAQGPAGTTAGFVQTTNGQDSELRANVFKNDTDLGNGKLDTQGDIRVDGEFSKKVNSFPTPTEDGHYLRITMPIKMDFQYDVDNDILQSAEATISNRSIEAKNTANVQQKQEIPKEVEMTILDFEEYNNGPATMNSKIAFVNNLGETASLPDKKIELPFKLNITGAAGNQVIDHSIKSIKDHKQQQTNLAPITIGRDSAIKLKLESISNQTLGNKDLIQDGTTSTSHNLKLKFEYKKN